MTRFVGYAVDISGTALARYNLAATEKESAELEARQYLEHHPAIEVWSDDHRRVARLVLMQAIALASPALVLEDFVLATMLVSKAISALTFSTSVVPGH